ncbi:MAG: alcohol dehydrogenase catalytic domain-containing protein [Gammaproteobacteria bacterium]|nr:alcohol dehydrogenase catalytic domain-containing protein [Gammaproteobacteria bacterium]NIR84531.1 alcohol dehydrogenase catalytic domain-containing protein [Gammaproteobacteria bacterium]NIR90434.1 alcohol dehydrogenase catalytic domain-containing protein [Gammaproteobacteria bacterium]NIU05582.1 alcohol dehydrogenase catalytic domain-containing protein [Gammaproteobacteria bacterium]NIV52721.1 alcohol dehydrogenase catalytic domain-containing protein [Gammaproteobacteria bacterium]
MKAATFQGVRRVAVREKPTSAILAPGDAIVEVELAGLCGSDLHPYRGRELGLDPGATMGHEFTGRVVEVGREVEGIRPGDTVMSPFSTSCGRCGPCTRGLSARCERGALFGWVQDGRGLEGAQAEYVRVPLAGTTLMARPRTLNALEALLLGDVVATGFYVAERGGVGVGEAVAVLGLGAVGLAAVMASRQAGAYPVLALDAVPERLAVAESLGAAVVPTVNDAARLRSDPDIAAEVRRLAGGEGVAVALEAVGTPEATRLALALLRPGGTLGVGGFHTEPVFAVSPGQAYDKNLTISAGRCPVRSRLEALCALQERERLPLERLVTHRVPLSEAADAYRLFDERAQGCVKLVFEPR